MPEFKSFAPSVQLEQLVFPYLSYQDVPNSSQVMQHVPVRFNALNATFTHLED
jgi:hypothetical protein